MNANVVVSEFVRVFMIERLDEESSATFSRKYVNSIGIMLIELNGILKWVIYNNIGCSPKGINN